MKRDFQKSMPLILRYEGGYSNHPRDPGGVTLEGIIQRVYDGYRDRKGLKRRPLTAAMRGTAEWKTERDDIYRTQYWNAIRADELPPGVDLFLFDSAVNSGPFQAAKWLQRALRMNDVDGHIGEATLAAVLNHPDHDALIADMAARRLGMLQHLSTWDAFGKGWTARVANAKSIAQAWATGSVGPQPAKVHEDGGQAKAYASDVAQPAMDAGTAVKAGIGGGVVTGAIDSAKDALAPVAGSSDWVTQIFTILTVIGVAISIGTILYSLWANHKTSKARHAIDGDVLANVPEGKPA
ncbi:N-acetylmuramidase [Bradyrhizobium quebecense]|uniref:Glycoside hydrolase family 108 protein n=1 Tax=Bradyrhizobium quebecense TaxID=2748629 RepID=A0A973WUV9_9BRAD|nr:glycoside hydrolase family 108 protein [Bradyrhizobium quebecense]UGA45991.1 N-acetylmuramidase [Bradyrhizobium quebecense]